MEKHTTFPTLGWGGGVVQLFIQKLSESWPESGAPPWNFRLGTDSCALKLTYPQNLASPRSSATVFGKCCKIKIFNTYQGKKVLKYPHLWGDVPRRFLDCGTRPPAFGANGQYFPPSSRRLDKSEKAFRTISPKTPTASWGCLAPSFFSPVSDYRTETLSDPAACFFFFFGGGEAVASWQKIPW